MKLLFDENMPFTLAKHLSEHECVSVRWLGWTGTKNGKLLSLAEENGFNAIVTLDDDIPAEQNMTGRQISVVILKPAKQGKASVIDMADDVKREVAQLSSGVILRIIPRNHSSTSDLD